MDNNTFVGDVVDRGPWLYWDTQNVAQAGSTGTSIQFFTLPVSATRSKLLTNIKRANQIENGYRFTLKGLGFYFSPDCIEEDIRLFDKNSYFEFKIGDKTYHEGLINQFPAGLGYSGYSTRSNLNITTNGVPNLMTMRQFDPFSRVIPDNMQFSLILYFPTAQTMTTTALGGVGVNLIAVMDGVLDRLVQ